MSEVVVTKTSSLTFFNRLMQYFHSMKPLQTGLLLFTGVMAYIASAMAFNWAILLLYLLSSFLVVGGTTVLNMVYDRDIDQIMKRTKKRALPAGKVHVNEMLFVGFSTIVLGLFLAVYINYLTAIVLAMGSFLDLVVYTLALKRRHRYSIIFGGIAGGMPALAGRTAAIASIDLIGILFVVFIAAWVPIHILTLAIVYQEDYRKAGVPMWPVQKGNEATLKVIGLASIIAPLTFLVTGYLLQIYPIIMVLVAIPSAYLIFMCIKNMFSPDVKRNWIIFKFASIYMVLTYLLLPFHS